MDRLVHGDFGISLWYKRPVIEELKAYSLPTLELAFCAALLFLLLGVPLGILSAVHRNSLLDHGARLFALTGVSLPIFLLGLILQLVFYRTLRWFPAGGRIDPFIPPPQSITGLYILDSLLTGNWQALASALHHLALPAVTLAYGSAAIASRMTRSCFLEVLGQEYIRAARAKGLSEQTVLTRHALRNAFIPIITIAVLQIGSLLSGVLLVEIIFSWPGLGTYAYTSAVVLDVNAIMAITLITALIYIGVNLLADLLYVLIDPRIRYT
jgi:peptide/nickel transport system permease protein